MLLVSLIKSWITFAPTLYYRFSSLKWSSRLQSPFENGKGVKCVQFLSLGAVIN